MLSVQNIESELSYAYLHALASRAGFACGYTTRHLDGAGVDAVISEDNRRLSPDSQLFSFDVHVQLKATTQIPVEQRGRFSFSLKIPQYNRLRNTNVNSPRILVVLYLPPEEVDWLSHSEEYLVSRRCAYWVSLRNAPESQNAEYQTVYVPRNQVLSISSLTELMTRFSRREEINYEG